MNREDKPQNETPLLLEQPGVVSVWIGHAKNEAEWDTYLEEQYDKDDAPLNEFAADFGLGRFYDHDMQEAFFIPGGDLLLAELLNPNSYSASFVEAVVIAAQQMHIEAANASILLYDYAYSAPIRQTNIRNRVRFLGVFPYDQTVLQASQ